MKRELGIISVSLCIIAVSFMNQMIRIDYNLNMIEYIALSSDYTVTERVILDEYGTLTYGGNITEPPLGKYYEDTGQYLGLVTDLIYAMAIELETDIVMQPLVWDDALESLRSGEIDLCDLTPSPERAKDYIFTDRIYDLNGVALIDTKYSEEIKRIEDLDGRLVGVQRGDYIIEALNEKGIYPNYIYSDNLTKAMGHLEDGNVIALVGDEPVIKNHLSDGRYQNRYEIIGDKVYESYVVLGMPKSHNDLRPIIDKAIFRMKKSGVLQKVQGKWLGTDTAADEKRANEKMKSVVVAIVALSFIALYLVYAWNRNLKRLVDERTLELRHITDELETILDNIKSTIILIDDNGIVRKVKGVVPGQLINDEDFDGISFMDHAALKEIDAKFQSMHGLHLYEAQSGSTFDFGHMNSIYSCYVTPIDSKIPLVLLILSDETLERIQKAEIFQSNKMAAVGRLAAGIAHELRNPLGTVRNSTFILKDSEALKDDDRMAIESIERSVSRASCIIESLLNYSRLNESVDSNIKLKDLLSEVMNYFKKSPENRNVDFAIEIAEHIELISNESALRHIVTNLVSNGLDAMNREGKLSVTATVEDAGVEIVIQDEGEGIDAKNVDRIFDPFFTTKPVGQGTGLGLYIVYAQVEKIGGSIQVKSSKGLGSTFKVRLPNKTA